MGEAQRRRKRKGRDEKRKKGRRRGGGKKKMGEREVGRKTGKKKLSFRWVRLAKSAVAW